MKCHRYLDWSAYPKIECWSRPRCGFRFSWLPWWLIPRHIRLQLVAAHVHEDPSA